jgi:acyl-coenzyme A synthetase/AMP-(fatty) acid ligase
MTDTSQPSDATIEDYLLEDRKFAPPSGFAADALVRSRAVRQRAQGAWRRGGDRVAIYLPMIPEAVVAMLACARIGAPHSVVFGGFSAEALRSRIDDAEAKVVITADGGFRRGPPCRSSPPSTRRSATARR